VECRTTDVSIIVSELAGVANEEERGSAAAPVAPLTMCPRVWLDTEWVFAIRLLGRRS
jgi:hypothetical protein